VGYVIREFLGLPFFVKGEVMTLLNVLVILGVWYVVMGLLCTLVAAINGSLRATQHEKYDGRQFSMAGIVLFIFMVWPYLMFQNWRCPERSEVFPDETPD
jgi:uncharacterized membrane protein